VVDPARIISCYLAHLDTIEIMFCLGKLYLFKTQRMKNQPLQRRSEFLAYTTLNKVTYITIPMLE
jgi:hypothetical protein